ncbi:MAG: GPR endopeptidase [Oscillospiraceae bacterium]|nr:GPR endopeptidase [Oscillospiraceae bacterium]
MNNAVRTDLALEARELWREGAAAGEALAGVEAYEIARGAITVSAVDILDAEGERALGKPRGRYVTVELDALARREENAFADACTAISEQLSSLLKLEESGSVLVAGLGNRGITPDAVGPETIDWVMATRHLKQTLPEDFAAFRPVSAVCSGVLGTTGVESGELIAAVAERVQPDAIIAIDALAARSIDRLCRTVQLSDTGIVPGSGVGNARTALSRETIGVPVIAVGVPTVVDAGTLVADLARGAGLDAESAAMRGGEKLIVTPRDIDKNIRDAAKLIGYSINLALHSGLTLADVDVLLS